jgi:hypothetical protein
MIKFSVQEYVENGNLGNALLTVNKIHAAMANSCPPKPQAQMVLNK